MNCYLVLLPKMVVAILSRGTSFLLDLSLKHFFSSPSSFSIRLLRWSTPKRSLQRPSCWLCILNCRMVSWEMFCQPKFGIQREEGSSHHLYSLQGAMPVFWTIPFRPCLHVTLLWIHVCAPSFPQFAILFLHTPDLLCIKFLCWSFLSWCRRQQPWIASVKPLMRFIL